MWDVQSCFSINIDGLQGIDFERTEQELLFPSPMYVLHIKFYFLVYLQKCVNAPSDSIARKKN